jgi:hypothetical protein
MMSGWGSGLYCRLPFLMHSEASPFAFYWDQLCSIVSGLFSLWHNNETTSNQQLYQTRNHLLHPWVCHRFTMTYPVTVSESLIYHGTTKRIRNLPRLWHQSWMQVKGPIRYVSHHEWCKPIPRSNLLEVWTDSVNEPSTKRPDESFPKYWIFKERRYVALA